MGGGGGAASLFFFFPPVQQTTRSGIGHRVIKYSEVVFFWLATNALNARNNNNNKQQDAFRFFFNKMFVYDSLQRKTPTITTTEVSKQISETISLFFHTERSPVP